jgi:hypothetical protein
MKRHPLVCCLRDEDFISIQGSERYVRIPGRSWAFGSKHFLFAAAAGLDWIGSAVE